LILDPEPDKVERRLSSFPIHSEEEHALTAMRAKYELRGIVCAVNNEVIAHSEPPALIVSADPTAVNPGSKDATFGGTIGKSAECISSGAQGR
jgi:hypothetical protein